MTCAPNATRTRDLPLRRSFHAVSQPAVFLVRAGLLIVWLQLNVSGFRPVLARGWHGPRLSMRTAGAALLAVERCALNVPVAVLRWCRRGIYGRAAVNSGSGCGTCVQQRD